MPKKKKPAQTPKSVGRVERVERVMSEESGDLTGFLVSLFVRPEPVWLSETRYRAVLGGWMDVASRSKPDDLFDVKFTETSIKISLKKSPKRKGYDLHLLGYYYQRLLSQWQEAGRIFRSTQKSKDRARKAAWRNEIKSVYEDMPDDLLEKLSLKGGSSPSELALEHAARLCDVPDNKLSASYLYEVLRSQKGVEWLVEVI